MEWNLIVFSEKEKYIGHTLACQDIDAYAGRDIGKSRDMTVGMMPPKLVQMMINISDTPRNSAIYDPFCGLGTTLIEAANMGFNSLFGSDISREMAVSSQKSLEAFITEERLWQERIKKVGGTPHKDFSTFHSNIIELDARKIQEAPKKL
jgi:tRNA G10  N-methylase Trm11